MQLLDTTDLLVPSEILVPIPSPGISDIKRIELGKKWGSLWSQINTNWILCIYATPPDEVFLARHKVEKNAKKAVKRSAKAVRDAAMDVATMEVATNPLEVITGSAVPQSAAVPPELAPSWSSPM